MPSRTPNELPIISRVGVQRHDAIDYHVYSIIVLAGLKHDLFLFECAKTRLLQQRNQQTFVQLTYRRQALQRHWR